MIIFFCFSPLQVREPSDFPNEGIVCSLLCGNVLKCGHLCESACRHQCEHSSFCQCIVKSTFQCGHPYKIVCYKQNNMQLVCQVSMQITLPCGHNYQLACHDQRNHPICQVNVQTTLPCGHLCQRACHDKDKNFLCQTIVQSTLPCGHPCEIACYKQDDAHSSVCQVIMQTTLPCGHLFSVMCDKVEVFKISKCPASRCTKKLNCGHQCPLKCAQQCDTAKCETLIEIPNYLYPIKCCNRDVRASVCNRPIDRQALIPIPIITDYRTFPQEPQRRPHQDLLTTSQTSTGSMITEPGNHMTKESHIFLKKICCNIL